MLWRFDRGELGHISSPAVVEGVVYVGSYEGYLYALDAESGEMLWRFKAGDRVYSSPAVVEGVVYTGSGDGYLYALDADSGKMLWRDPWGYGYPVGGEFRTEVSSTAVADGVVYVGSGGWLYALGA